MLYAVRNSHGVFPIPHKDDAAGDLAAVLFHDAAAQGGPYLHSGHILHIYGYAIVGPHKDVLYVFQGLYPSQAPYQVLRAALFQNPCADGLITGRNVLEYVLQRHPVGNKFVGVHVYLVFLDKTTYAGNVGYPRGRF